MLMKMGGRVDIFSYQYPAALLRGAPPQLDCKARVAAQEGHIEEVRQKFEGKRIALLPSYGEEVKGVALMEVARELYERGQLEI